MPNNDIPLWVKKIENQGGRDHLGIESVGQVMLEEISCGISNITERLRYFSLFCWVLQKFLASKLKKTISNYRMLLNKITFLYALSNSLSHLEEANTGINGIEFIRRNINGILSQDFKLDDSLFKSNAPINNNWIYRGKLNDLKLLLLTSTGIPKIVEPNGLKLAKVFDNLNLGIDFEELDLNNYSSEDRLRKLESKWCYHRLSENEEERQLLEDILFSKSYKDYSISYKELNRRYTFIFLLKYINELHLKSRQEFEKWVYFNKEELPKNLSHILNLWKILFARNYLVFSLESLFYFFIQKIEAQPLSDIEFIDIIKNINIDNEIMQKLNANKKFKNVFEMKISLLLENLYPSDTANIEAHLSRSNILSETNLILFLEANVGHRISEDILNLYIFYPIFCLFSLYYRWSQKTFNDDASIFMKMGDSKRFSLDHLIQYLKNSITKNSSVGDIIIDLYYKFILPQHLNVSYEKLRDRNIDTFHFSFDNNKYYFISRNQEFTPNYNFMKINEMFNFLQDLDLINEEDKNYFILTSKAKNLLNQYYE